MSADSIFQLTSPLDSQVKSAELPTYETFRGPNFASSSIADSKIRRNPIILFIIQESKIPIDPRREFHNGSTGLRAARTLRNCGEYLCLSELRVELAELTYREDNIINAFSIVLKPINSLC